MNSSFVCLYSIETKQSCRFLQFFSVPWLATVCPWRAQHRANNQECAWTRGMFGTVSERVMPFLCTLDHGPVPSRCVLADPTSQLIREYDPPMVARVN